MKHHYVIIKLSQVLFQSYLYHKLFIFEICCGRFAKKSLEELNIDSCSKIRPKITDPQRQLSTFLLQTHYISSTVFSSVHVRGDFEVALLKLG